jgi:hypothetical protein
MIVLLQSAGIAERNSPVISVEMRNRRDGQALRAQLLWSRARFTGHHCKRRGGNREEDITYKSNGCRDVGHEDAPLFGESVDD